MNENGVGKKLLPTHPANVQAKFAEISRRLPPAGDVPAARALSGVLSRRCTLISRSGR